MSVLQRIKSAIPAVEDEQATVTEYECLDCGNTFESAKTPDRAQCMECLSRDVERA